MFGDVQRVEGVEGARRTDRQTDMFGGVQRVEGVERARRIDRQTDMFGGVQRVEGVEGARRTDRQTDIRKKIIDVLSVSLSAASNLFSQRTRSISIKNGKILNLLILSKEFKS